MLSNLINSGIYSTYVLIQFKSQSLLQHLRDGWEVSGLLKQHFIIPVPAQMRSPGEDWYRGTADAIYQNINLIEQADPHFVVIFGADHIYRMNIREMLEFHMHKRAQATIAAIPVPQRACGEFGVIEASPDGVVVGVSRKAGGRARPCRTIRSACTRRWAITFFRPTCCCANCTPMRENENSSHDFGRDILPSLVGRTEMYAYDFQTNRIPGDPPAQEPYWRDVGTIDSYFEANMDLRSVTPALNLYNRQWPLRTAGYSDAPAKFIFDQEGRRGQAIDSIVAGGTILSGGTVRRFGARPRRAPAFRRAGGGFDPVRQRATSDGGRGCGGRFWTRTSGFRKTPRIGYDLDRDRQMYHVTESGIVVMEGFRSTVEVAAMLV